MLSSLEENVLLNTEDREQVRVRGVRGAQLTSRDIAREPERRPNINVQPPSSLVQYTPNTPPQNEGILSFALRRKRRIDISGTLARHTGRKEKDIQAHWPRRKKGYSGSLATGDTGPIHKCEHTGSGHIGPGHIGPIHDMSI